jgi:hypothetical protein
VADDARELVAQAEREVESGNHQAALKALERAYVPVQKARDLETTNRALELARRLAADEEVEARHRRKARGIVEWYAVVVRGHAQSVARAERVSPVRAHPPSLAWIDGLVVTLSLFVVLVLIAGVLVAISAETTNERIAGIGGAAFWTTMLLALIAVLRLLQAIERNTAPAAASPPKPVD